MLLRPPGNEFTNDHRRAGVLNAVVARDIRNRLRSKSQSMRENGPNISVQRRESDSAECCLDRDNARRSRSRYGRQMAKRRLVQFPKHWFTENGSLRETSGSSGKAKRPRSNASARTGPKGGTFRCNYFWFVMESDPDLACPLNATLPGRGATAGMGVPTIEG